MNGNHKDPGGNAVRTEEDVHRLRGIKLKGTQQRSELVFGKTARWIRRISKSVSMRTPCSTMSSSSQPTGSLVAVGPPPGKLKIELKIFVNGEPIKKLGTPPVREVWVVTGDVSRVKKLNDVLVQANGHQWQLRVPENNTGTGHKFTLCAMQKDNRECWIRDWIKHYRKMGVDRVILYDNNSKRLPDVDAIVIPCPYILGLSKYRRVYGRQVYRTAFLHEGILTICSYKYRSGHLLNFDIDELLQVESLEKYGKRKVVYFDSYFVETKTDEKLPEDCSFRHFVYRNASLRHSHFKYIVKMDKVLWCSVHQVLFKKKKRWVSRKIVRKLKRLWHYLGGKEDVFYHYRGINTGWKLDRSAFGETTEVVKIGD